MRMILSRSVPDAIRITAALLLLAGLVLFNFSAQAAESNYAEVGWWHITYKVVDDMNGCDAGVQFRDQTKFTMALIQTGANKSWVLFLSNPAWNSWIKKGKQYTLLIVTNKVWRGTFEGTDYHELFEGDLSIEFMNNIADADSVTILDEDKRLLTAKPLDMKDSAAAIKATVNCVREHAAPVPTAEADTTISGTGFFVAPNLLLTNNHVIKDCKKDIQVRYPDRASHTAKIYGRDETNDLALLNTDMGNLAVASFHLRPRLGESAATLGFPYADILSSSGNFTLGNVTSLSGMGDDTRFLQMSTPTQPGNSGGPLLDMSGRVVGVVVSQLNALTMMQAGNSVPQNVNFAIQVPIVINFLSIKDVTPQLEASGAGRSLSPSDVADMAKQFTVQIYCKGVLPKSSALD